MKAEHAKKLESAAGLGLFFLLYYLTAELGLRLQNVSGFAAFIWPPTGIAIAGMLLYGPRILPFVYAGAFTVNLLHGAPILAALGMALGNTLEAFVASLLLHKVGFKNTFERLRDSLYFIVFGSILSTVISPTIGVTSLLLTGMISAGQYFETWTTWWVGDILGALVVAPLLLSWASKSFWFKRIKRVRLIQSAGALALLILICYLIYEFPLKNDGIVRPYMLFPPIILFAIAFRQRGATFAIALISALATRSTLMGTGQFTGGDLNANLLRQELFIGMLAMTSLLTASIMTEREKALKRATAANMELEQKIDERTRMLLEAQNIAHFGSWEWDVDENILTWTDELFRIHGLEPGMQIGLEAFIDMAHPDDRPKVRRGFDQALKVHTPFDFIERIVRPDGQERFVRIEGRVLLNEDGEVAKLFGSCLDMTEEEKIKRDLMARNEELEAVNKIMVSREVRMAEIKEEISELKKKINGKNTG